MLYMECLGIVFFSCAGSPDSSGNCSDFLFVLAEKFDMSSTAEVGVSRRKWW